MVQKIEAGSRKLVQSEIQKQKQQHVNDFSVFNKVQLDVHLLIMIKVKSCVVSLIQLASAQTVFDV